MFNLTSASKEIKTFLKWGAILIVFLIVLFFLVKIVIALKETLYPTPPPKPTVSFGKIPTPFFPKNATDKKITFSLDTVSGKLPNSPTQLKIFKTQKPKADLLSLKNASGKTAALGFTENETKVDDSVYSWTNQNKQLPQTLTFNIISGNFTLKTDLSTSSAILTPKTPPTESAAADLTQNFLQNINADLTSIDTSQTQTKLLTLQNDKFTEATSLSTTTLVRVDFFQNNLNGYPIFYEMPNQSNINFLVGRDASGLEIVSANFLLQNPSNESSTYPLISTAEAFNKLKEGKAYIASYFGTKDSASIKNIYLAYYISSKVEDYIEPVIVFEGDDGFFAYVPAITDEWLGN